MNEDATNVASVKTNTVSNSHKFITNPIIEPVMDSVKLSHENVMSNQGTQIEDNDVKVSAVTSDSQSDGKDWTMLVSITIGNKTIPAVVDTASQATLINEELFSELNLTCDEGQSISIRGVGQASKMKAKLVKEVTMQIGTQTLQNDLLVAPIVDKCILGLDFLKQNKALIDLDGNMLVLNNELIPASWKRNQAGEQISVCRVELHSKVKIPPHSVMVTQCKLDRPTLMDCVIEPYHPNPAICMPRVVVKSDADNEPVPVCIINNSDVHVTLHANELIGIGTASEILQEESDPSQHGSLDHDTNSDDNLHDVTSDSTDLKISDDTNADSVTSDIRRCQTDITSVPSDTSSVKTENQNSDAEIDEDDIEAWLADVSLYEDKDIPKHLQKLYEDAAKRLTTEQCKILRKLLIEFEDVFAKNDLDLGRFTLIKHPIKTTATQPVRQRMRRTPIGFQDEEEKHLMAMLSQEVIQHSTSDWAAAPVLIRKVDGSIRYCIDFRGLNACTIKDAFPLPLIEECLDALSGTEFFSTLDMQSGYWQIEIEPEDRHKTAFITKYGLFEHVRMAFGLCNAPATHQRAMNLILKGLLWKEVLAYLDDTIVLGKSFLDQVKNLRKVLKRFRAHNLKLKPRKCKLFRTEVEFLGRTVSQDGVSIQKAKIETVLKWPTPKSRNDVEKFVGFVNYHREFIPQFAKKAESLYKLTCKDQDFEWTPVQEQSFEALKQAMVTAPVLAYPNATDPYILDTDASESSIGAELLQIQSSVERPVAYASLTLKPAQLNYCTTRKELLAVVVFTRQYRHYLLGKKFTVRTDHHSLVWLMRFKEPQGQLCRWLEELSQYDMDIKHRPGKLHQNADALSRIPDNLKSCSCYEAGKDLSSLPCGGCKYCTRCHEQWSRFEQDVDDVVPLAVRAIHVLDSSQMEEEELEANNQWIRTFPVEEVRDLQLADTDIRPLISWLERARDPSNFELFVSGPATKHFWSCRNQLKLKNGVLYYEWVDGPLKRLKLLVPDALKMRVMELAHDVKTAGHSGQDKTLRRIQRSFIWYRMGLDIKLYVETCATCNKNKKPRVKPKAAMESFHAGIPMERVHLDILGPLQLSENRNKYVLLMVDQFTKWIECQALPEQTAEKVAKAAMNEFFCRMGCPLQSHSDQGKQFTGNVFTQLCAILEIAKTRTTPYRPSSNGQVERYNRDLLKVIRCFLTGKQNKWDEYLPLIGMAIRSTENRATGFTANMMMLGREVVTPLEMITGVATANAAPQDPAVYVKDLTKRLREIHALAREKIGQTQRYQKRTYDLKLVQKAFQVGDLVYKLDSAASPGETRKLKPVYIGPFLVTEVLSPLLYRVEGRRKSQVLHHDRLRFCGDRFIPMWIRRKRHELLDLDATIAYDEDELEQSMQVIAPQPDPVAQQAPQPHVPVAPVRNEPIAPVRDEPEPQPRNIQQNQQAQIVNDEPVDYGLEALFHEPVVTRTGRAIHRPGYLADYT